jgi:hypothetical protein
LARETYTILEQTKTIVVGRNNMKDRTRRGFNHYCAKHKRYWHSSRTNDCPECKRERRDAVADEPATSWDKSTKHGIGTRRV